MLRYRMETVVLTQDTGLPYTSSSCGGQVSVFPRASEKGEWVRAGEAKNLEAQRDAVLHANDLVQRERDAALARVKELEALTAEQRLVIAGWTETAAAQQARIAELDGEGRYGSCFTVAERFKKEQGDTSLFTADWLESRLKKLAELEASKPLRELSAIKQAAFPHGFMGSAEELPAWLDQKLTEGKERLHRLNAAWANDIRLAESLGKAPTESMATWIKNLVSTKNALIAERDYLQKMAASWGWTDEKPLTGWLNARLRTLRKLFSEDERQAFEETSTPY